MQNLWITLHVPMSECWKGGLRARQILQNRIFLQCCSTSHNPQFILESRTLKENDSEVFLPSFLGHTNVNKKGRIFLLGDSE